VGLPWRHYVAVSQKEPARIVAAIQNATAPRRQFWEARNSSAPFEGAVDQGRFTLSRIISYRNSFLPVITGQIIPVPTGSQVVISMRPSWFALVFWVVWMSGVTAFLAILLLLRRGVQNRPIGITVALGLFLFGYLLCAASFGFEARRAYQMLRNMIDDQRPVL
jgi:hypothetical protein